jgi:hypothetical protein
VGGVTDTTKPRAHPGSGRPSSRSRWHHLGMARAPARPGGGGGGGGMDPWGPGGGGLTKPATPFSDFASLKGGASLKKTFRQVLHPSPAASAPARAPPPPPRSALGLGPLRASFCSSASTTAWPCPGWSTPARGAGVVLA